VKGILFNSTIPDISLSIKVTASFMRDFDKSFALSHFGTPFEYSAGTGDTGIDGAIDR